MADLHRARRRADDFARLVDGKALHSPSAVDDAEFTDSLAIVEQLRTVGAVTPRAEFSQALRVRLLEAAGPVLAAVADPDSDDQDSADQDAEPVVDPKQTRRAKRRRRGRVVAGVSALAVLGGGIGTAAAAQRAVPGDSLYSMKRGIEQMSTRVSVSDDSRGRRELAHALTRLTEAEKLVRTNGQSSRINAALRDFSTQARGGSSHLLSSYSRTFDASDVDRVYVFTEEARSTLTELAPSVPAGSRQPVAEALGTLSQIAAQASKLCPVCLVPTSRSTALPAPSDSDPTSPGSTSKDDPKVPPAVDPSLKTPTTVSVPMTSTGTQTAPPPKSDPTRPSVPVPSVPTVPSTKPSLPSLPTLPTPRPPGRPSTGPSLPLPTLPTITLPGITISGLPPLLPPITLGLPKTSR